MANLASVIHPDALGKDVNLLIALRREKPGMQRNRDLRIPQVVSNRDKLTIQLDNIFLYFQGCHHIDSSYTNY